MVDKLYEYLKGFMIHNNWYDENISEQARAIFTTICIVGNLDVDTSKVDEMMNDLYYRAAMECIMGFDEFEDFMYKYLV